MSQTHYLHHPWRGLFNGLLCAALLALAACAQLPDQEKRASGMADENRPLVFPPPPETPRFIFERTIRGSADIAAAKTESAFKQLVSGVDAVDSVMLSKPYAIAVNRGRIFVSDTAMHVVQVFDVPEARHFLIGEDDPGHLGKPLGIDVDAAGNLYVADSLIRAVMVYDRDGKYLRTLGASANFDRLTSVTVDKKGERIYATDLGGVDSLKHRIVVLDAHTGEHLFDIGKRGEEAGELNLPADVAIGKGGNLYVVDAGNFRIQVFDPAGNYLQKFGQLGRVTGDFARPREVATDADGNVYVTDGTFGNFQIFDPDGQLLLFIGEHSEQGGQARYMLPAGIYVDEDGRVYVADQWFRKLEIYRPAALREQDGYLVRKAPATESEKKAAEKK